MSISTLTKAALLAVVATSSPLITLPAFAVDEINVTNGATVPGPGLAVHGYDVVSYHSDGKPEVGDAQYSYVYENATYRFSSQEHMRQFKADPARYAPAYGGFCAYGVALGKKFDGDPNFWKIVDGQLYLNLNSQIQSEWSKDIKGNIQTANTNWTDIETVAVADL